MLAQIKPAYQKDAIRFLLLVVYEREHAYWLNLELYRLCFIDQQRVSKDLPLTGTPVDTDELVIACNRLENRIRSHTLGLLEIESVEQIDDIYGEIHDKDRIQPKEVRIFHRTVKDFLLGNESAKSLLKTAGEESHLRLSIARGTLSHLNHLARRTEKYILHEGTMPPHLELLRSAMTQIATVEKLVGAAQWQLMRSLDSYALMPKLVTLLEDESGHQRSSPIHDLHVFEFRGPNLVDMVAMAARSGTIYYVCEILGLPKPEIRQRHVELLQHKQLSHHDEEFVPGFCLDVPGDSSIDYSHYRQHLQQLLRREPHARLSHQAGGERWESTAVETYLLNCLPYPQIFGSILELLALARILLDAGANPMEPMKLAIDERHEAYQWSRCFWDLWLSFLEFYEHVEDPILQDVYNMTKLLLNKGVQINHKRHGKLGLDSYGGMQEPEPGLSIYFEYEAMYTLVRAFQGFPEFQQFARAVDPSRTKQLGSILYIAHKTQNRRKVVYPTEEERETLWSLIESWDAKSNPSALSAWDELTLATQKIFQTHLPDVKFPINPINQEANQTGRKTSGELEGRHDESDSESQGTDE
ncbi:MAG: hypothetical protein Q9196_007341 [Gyalolechia fulgens]